MLKILKHIISIGGILVFCILLATLCAWFVSPQTSLAFAYLGLGFPLVFCLSLLYIIWWIYTSRWIALLCFVLLLFYPTITYFAIPLKNVSDSHSSLTETIRVMSYNVQAFNGNIMHRDGSSIFSFIVDTNADVVCLQEFLISKEKGGNKELEKQYKYLFENYPYYSVVELSSSNSWYIYGLACFSKYPITETKKVEFPVRTKNGAARFVIRKGDKEIAIYNSHLESNRITSKDKELYNAFWEDRNSQFFKKSAQNIGKKLATSFQIRAEQANTLRDQIQKTQDQYRNLIVCGDFNDTPISYAYYNIKGHLKDAFVTKGKGPGYTYNQGYMKFRIDHIFFNEAFSVQDVNIFRVNYSDHYPVVATFSMNES